MILRNNKGGESHPFFIMHLSKLPTIFVKGGEERKAYFTVQARELIAAGWVEKTDMEPKKKDTEMSGAKKEEQKPEVKPVVESKPRAVRTRLVNEKIEE